MKEKITTSRKELTLVIITRLCNKNKQEFAGSIHYLRFGSGSGSLIVKLMKHTNADKFK